VVVLLGQSNAASAAKFGREVQAKMRGLSVVGAATVQRRLALAFLNVVIPGTPVDTGRARGGWQVELDRVPRGESGVLDKTAGGRFTRARASLRLGALQRNPRFTVVYVANNVPYIEVLDRGYHRDRSGKLRQWSRRGHGFFERGLRYLRSMLRS
jgi:hypothetical protein